MAFASTNRVVLRAEVSLRPSVVQRAMSSSPTDNVSVYTSVHLAQPHGDASSVRSADAVLDSPHGDGSARHIVKEQALSRSKPEGELRRAACTKKLRQRALCRRVAVRIPTLRAG